MTWKRARTLADAGQYDAALAAIRVGLARNSEDFGLLWLQAGITGEAGRHREAVALYETLTVRHPDRAHELWSDLGTQKLWADDPAGAVRDLDAALKEAPNDLDVRKTRALALSHAGRLVESLQAYDALLVEKPGDVDLELERARVLSWMGRNTRAAATYREILRQHPGNASAKLGLAQNENWAGNHRKAAALFQDLPHGDPEAQKGLAYAYYWDGRAVESRAALDGYLVAHPDDREGRELAGLLARDGSPSLTTRAGRSDDSDGLRVRTTTMEARYPVRGQTTLIAGWQRDNVKDNLSNRDPLRIGGGIETTWPRWSAQLVGYVLEPGRDENADALGELNVTHRPVDRVRIDAGWAKDVVMTRVSLAKHIMLRVATLGADWQAQDAITLTGAVRQRFYSDDNEATHLSASGKMWVITGPHARLALTFGGEHLATAHDRGDGYYAPKRYREIGPGAVIELKPREEWSFEVSGQLGQQQEAGAHAELFHNLTGTAEIPLGRALALAVGGTRTNSSLASLSGYREKRWAASLTTRF